MIDLHSHILPGIDDGADSLSKAVQMCRIAADQGCEAIVATPHQRHPSWWNTEPVKLGVLADRVRERLGDSIRLYLGAEIRVGPRFIERVHQVAEDGLLPLADSSYLLLEFRRRELDVDPLTLVQATGRAGWRPIIAHPEFVEPLRRDPALVYELVQAGAYLQITAMSLTGHFGQVIQTSAFDLIDRQLAHFVASDAHGVRHRPPGLKRAHRMIVSRWGNAVAKSLVDDNPRAVIENRPVAAGVVRSPSVS